MKEEYLILIREYIEEDDEIEKEKLAERLDNLWYYHLSPLEKQQINQEIGKHRK